MEHSLIASFGERVFGVVKRFAGKGSGVDKGLEAVIFRLRLGDVN
jgi:hypothetical protein